MPRRLLKNRCTKYRTANTSSGWTGNASVPGAFSAERGLALLPNCVENLPSWPNVQALSHHSPLNYFEIAQSAYSIETIFYRCTPLMSKLPSQRHAECRLFW